MIWGIFLISVVSAVRGMISEVDGVVEVDHYVNMSTFKEYLKEWTTGMNTESLNYRLGKMLGMHRMHELSIVLEAIVGTIPEDIVPAVASIVTREAEEEGVRGKKRSKRVKRNIFGDLIHTLTGVPTEEQMLKETQMLGSLSKKVTAVLEHQVSLEKDVESYLSGLQKKELDMEKEMSELFRDTSSIARMMVYDAYFSAEKERLEDILEAQVKGEVPVRLAAFLGRKAGIKGVPKFSYVSARFRDDLLQVKFRACLFVEGMVEEVTHTNVSDIVSTQKRAYIVAPGANIEKFSEYEVRWSRRECSDCASMVHVGSQMYSILEEGKVRCFERSGVREVSMTRGHLFAGRGYLGCGNRAVAFGLFGLQEERQRLI